METRAGDAKRYWFPAKRYGWGWGVPSTWQGWVTMAVWLVLIAIDAIFVAERNLFLFQAIAIGLSIILIAICCWKGEPPRWRWGS